MALDKQMQKLIDMGAESKAKPIIEKYEAKIKALEEREKAVQDGEKALEKKKEEALKEEERLLAAEEEARAKADAEIRASEAEIRTEERSSIIADAKQEAEGMIAEARETVQDILSEAAEKEKLLDEADKKAQQIKDEALSKAKQLVSDAQGKAAKTIADADAYLEERMKRLDAAQQEANDARAEAIRIKKQAIEERREHQVAFLDSLDKHSKSVEQRFNEQFATLTEMQDELVRRRIQLEEAQEDAEEDRKYNKAKREEFAGYSKGEVDRLNTDIRILNGELDAAKELLEQQEQEITKLRKDLIGTEGKNLAEEVERLKAELEKERNVLAAMPSPARVADLEKAEKDLDALKIETAQLKEEKDKLARELALAHFSRKQLDSQVAVAEAYEALNDQLKEKLNFISETYKSNRGSKFAGLLEIDKEVVAADADRVDAPADLKQIVSYVRAWGATRDENRLYYQKETIMAFVASLAASFDASRLLILQGLSGTGKTSLPRLFAEALGLECDLVSVQPSWRDNRELLGYDNDFTNRFKETEFTKFVYAASKDQKRITLIILDEMNLARIEYYFADFLSELEMKLEKEKTIWTVPLISNYTEANVEERPDYLVYENGSASLRIGKNVWFVGTANNDDSTSTITDKVYDRAQILDLDRRAGRIVDVEKPEEKWTISLPQLEALFRAARNNDEYKMSNEDWENIHTLDTDCLQKMDITFGSRISSQLDAFVPVYVACGGTKEKAIDYYLAHKILRKLDEKFDAYIGRRLDDLEVMIEELYKKKDAFPETMAKIRSLRFKNFGQRDGE